MISVSLKGDSFRTAEDSIVVYLSGCILSVGFLDLIKPFKSGNQIKIWDFLCKSQHLYIDHKSVDGYRCLMSLQQPVYGHPLVVRT